MRIYFHSAGQVIHYDFIIIGALVNLCDLVKWFGPLRVGGCGGSVSGSRQGVVPWLLSEWFSPLPSPRLLDSGFARLAEGLNPGVSPPPFSPSVAIYTRVVSKTYAAFAQGSFSFTDQLSMTLGGRLNRDEKTYYLDHRRIRDAFVVANLTRKGSWDSFTPKVGLEYKATPDALIYVSAGKGFKSGGFNARPLADASEVTEYEPETLWTYEGGVKTAWLDRRLILNLAGYFSEYKNIQITVNQTPRNFVANAAAGEVKGVELEAQAKPSSAWDFNLGVGYCAIVPEADAGAADLPAIGRIEAGIEGVVFTDGS